MSKSTTFFIGLILGIVLGGAILFGFYAQEINDYNRVMSRLDDSEIELSSLFSYVTQLENDYDILSDNHNSMRSEYISIQSELQSLERENQNLESDLDHAETNWNSLSECVVDFISEQNSYTNVDESFTRIFTREELEKISDTIEDISRNEDNNWDGYLYIHKYVRDQIEYVYDSEIPAIATAWEKDSSA